jgi:ribosomal protein L25 (general stress protein Ctc)
MSGDRSGSGFSGGRTGYVPANRYQQQMEPQPGVVKSRPVAKAKQSAQYDHNVQSAWG